MPHDDEDEKEDEDMEDPDVRIQCKLAQIQAWPSAKVLIVGNPAQREREMREYSAIPNFQIQKMKELVGGGIAKITTNCRI
jgi:hypothetical protein